MSPVSGVEPRLVTITSKSTFCPSETEAGDLTLTCSGFVRGAGIVGAGAGRLGRLVGVADDCGSAAPLGAGSRDGPITGGLTSGAGGGTALTGVRSPSTC